MTSTTASTLPERVRVLVVGAGFAGLGTAIKLDEHGFADFLVVPPISMVTGGVTGSDTGMIAVYDADAKIDPPKLAQDLLVDLDILSRTPVGATNVVTDRGAYVVACRTGRDGAFPILATRTAAGDLTAIHIDFYWVDFDPGDDFPD